MTLRSDAVPRKASTSVSSFQAISAFVSRSFSQSSSNDVSPYSFMASSIVSCGFGACVVGHENRGSVQTLRLPAGACSLGRSVQNVGLTAFETGGIAGSQPVPGQKTSVMQRYTVSIQHCKIKKT